MVFIHGAIGNLAPCDRGEFAHCDSGNLGGEGNDWSSLKFCGDNGVIRNLGTTKLVILEIGIGKAFCNDGIGIDLPGFLG